jgi:hypothetical protein
MAMDYRRYQPSTDSGKHSLRLDAAEKGARQIVQKGPEFGPGSWISQYYTDHWTLAEWYADFAT